MAPVFSNNATSLLAVAINAAVTTVTVQTGDAAKFPAPTGGDWFPITVLDGLGNMEIMRCTARSGANLTVVRGQEGTTAQSFSIGARVDHRLTAAVLATFLPSANYTAADVLAKLLTVDGHTSGLNADLLDGEEGAFYLALGNATGTIEDDNLPSRIREGAQQVTDWNTVLSTGFYCSLRGIDGATNTPDGPTGAMYWIGHALRLTSSAWVRLLVWSISHTGVSTEYWTRIYNPNTTTWSAWERLRSTEAELDARYLRLAGGTITGGIVNNTGMSTRQFGMYWSDMSSNINEGSAIFGNNLYASFNGTSTDYKTTFTGSVGYAALRLAGTGAQVARATGATTANGIVTPTWFDVLDKGNYKGARSLGLTQANFSIGAANYDSPWVGYNSSHTLTLPSAATAGIGAVIGPLKAFDAIALTIQRSGSDVIKTNTTGGGLTSLVLAQGQEVRLVSDGSGSWYAYGLSDKVMIAQGSFSAVSQVALTLPPGFRRFKLNARITHSTTGQLIVGNLSTDGGATWINSAAAYGNDYFDKSNAVSLNVGQGTNTLMELMTYLSNAYVTGYLDMDIYEPRDASFRTMVRARAMAVDREATNAPFGGLVSSAWRANAEDNNAIRFYPQSGTITGWYTLEGIV